jgi:tetratricopeptide (TPR) repeat protein
MSDVTEPVGTLSVALEHAGRLLRSSPALAVEQAHEILRAVPNHPPAMLLLGQARLAAGDLSGAVATLEQLCAQQPRWAAAHLELGFALGRARRGEEAIGALRRAVRLKPDLPDAWRALGDHLTIVGDAEGADDAYAQSIKASVRDPRLMQAAMALCENRLAPAETLLREHLMQHPTDVAALRMLAEVAARLKRYGDAETLLERCLELAPSFSAARQNLALVLHRLYKPEEALGEVNRLLAEDPRSPNSRNLKAAVLSRIGEYDDSIRIYREILDEYPRQPGVWLSYGHALKTKGSEPESIHAYRRCVELRPAFGEAWWSLANLKTFRFTAGDVDVMKAQLSRGEFKPEDKFHLHFALGKALEDAGRYQESFEHYAEANRLRRSGIHYDPDENSNHVRRSKLLFTGEFFRTREGMGCPAPDPIFIIGLPRAGSTLLEQILASHSQVEGTMELPDVIGIVRELGGRKRREDESRYPEIVASLSGAELHALGERYLRQTRIQRKTGRSFFIDKMPNNFAHVGLIHLILPNAKIIDARRHPLGCCFSGFKQHFARGQKFTYSLEEIGRYYRDYVELMAHFDAVLPGRVCRVLYEDVVEDLERQVRRVLDHCGLPFEEQCLQFHRTERAVRTASSQQVRTPIYREGVDQWRKYDAWLGPLKEALGPVLAAYPAIPAF